MSDWFPLIPIITTFFREATRNLIRQDYANEFEEGQEEAGKIYVQLCLCLIRKVPEHHLELSLLENGEASPEEAQEMLMAAVHLNEQRKGQLSAWYAEVP